MRSRKRVTRLRPIGVFGVCLLCCEIGDVSDIGLCGSCLLTKRDIEAAFCGGSEIRTLAKLKKHIKRISRTRCQQD